MSDRFLAAVLTVNRFLAAVLTVIAVAWLVPLPAAGQAQTPAADTWTLPRTPDGQPDLQGIWSMATLTPLQRPARFVGKEFFTEEEAAELSKLLTAEGVDPLVGIAVAAETDERKRSRLRQSQEDLHYDNAIWLTDRGPKRLASRRTSLIVDPPDGKIPPLTPEGQKREADRAKENRFLRDNIAEQLYDSHETRTLGERCLTWRHEGPPLLPAPYNDRLQILQTPGHVTIFPEMRNNQVRIIPLDGRPHLPQNIRQWAGDSRARWEGNTLVVETTNFTHKTHFQGSSEALHVVERFTRVDADTIRYEFTVDDPTSWTRPWRAEIPMWKAEGRLYEYRCHEGNYDLTHILEIARNLEKAAAEAAKTGAR